MATTESNIDSITLSNPSLFSTLRAVIWTSEWVKFAIYRYAEEIEKHLKFDEKDLFLGQKTIQKYSVLDTSAFFNIVFCL